MNATYMLVQLRTDLDEQAYFRIVNLPACFLGEGTDMTPADARAYSRALLMAADDCEAFQREATPDILRVYRVAAGEIA